MRKAKFWYCTLLAFLSFFTIAAAQTETAPPKQLLYTLDSLKKQNNLTEWIYTRIDYSYAHPKETLSFLMSSQQQAWRNARSAPEQQAWLLLLNNQAYNQLYSGNILASINCYEQAYNYYNDHKLNADISDSIFKPWANNYTRLGDYEKAIFIQQKTLDYAIKERDHALAASMYNNLAISYRSIGDLKKAIECIRLGTAQTQPSAPITVLLNNTLADIYKEKNEFDAAEKVIGSNIIRQKKLKQDFETAYWLLSSYMTAGDVQLAKHNYAAANSYYQQGLNINEVYYKGNRLREKAYIITQLGKVKLLQKQGKPALAYFNQTLAALGLMDKEQHVYQNKIFGDNRLVNVFYQRSMAYLLMAEEKKALQNIQLALLAADKIRFELADVKTKQRFQSETREMAEKAIDIAFGLLEKTRQHHYAAVIVDILEQTKARTLLDDIRRNQQQLSLQTKDSLFIQKLNLERAITYHEKTALQEGNETKEDSSELKFKLEYIEKKLRERYPSLARTTDENFPGTSLLKKLPANVHFIAFFSGQNYIYAVEISNRQVKQIKRILNATLVKKHIEDFVTTYYHNGPEAMMNTPELFFKASQQIYSTLLGGLSFRKNEKLIIIPDELLGYLSFEGLVTTGTYQPSISAWPYLIKENTVSYAFSIQTWLDQSKRKTSSTGKSTGIRENFAGLFLTHQNDSKKTIPAVAREASALKEIVSGNFLMDKAASAKHFFEAFDAATVLHISTHSYLSGLQQEPTLALEDQQVFLFELSARKNAPALVVLSACRTADGMMAKGEGIISLSRGFAAIGTQGTIAGLWNVNDAAAAKITAGVYQHLLNGANISTALHQSKLNWLNTRQSTELEYLPYYWDALVFMGYDQKIQLPKAGFSLKKYGLIPIAGIIAAAGFATALIFFFRRKRKSG